jgi:ERCC4-type nuclease
MISWQEVRANIDALSGAEKAECELLAEFTSIITTKGYSEEELSKLTGIDTESIKYIFMFEKSMTLLDAITIADALGYKLKLQPKTV